VKANFGRLTVINRAKSSKRWQARYWCECSCGEILIVLEYNLQSGNTKSCGCLHREATATRSFKHGQSQKGKGSTYLSWYAMKQRCFNPKHDAYIHYGGRGISVCERWMLFENFLADMGEKPSVGMTIDRINVDGNYEPGNCRWATWSQQAYNKRKTSKEG